MVQTGGTILGEVKPNNIKNLSKKDKMVKQIIQSCWPACTAKDPFNPYGGEPFLADAGKNFVVPIVLSRGSCVADDDDVISFSHSFSHSFWLSHHNTSHHCSRT